MGPPYEVPWGKSQDLHGTIGKSRVDLTMRRNCSLGGGGVGWGQDPRKRPSPQTHSLLILWLAQCVQQLSSAHACKMGLGPRLPRGKDTQMRAPFWENRAAHKGKMGRKIGPCMDGPISPKPKSQGFEATFGRRGATSGRRSIKTFSKI